MPKVPGRFLPLWFSLVAFAAIPVLAQQQPNVPTGKIHGQVINFTGVPQPGGTVTAEQTSGPSAPTEKGVFKVDQNGEFSGDLPAGAYNLIYRDPTTPHYMQVDRMDNVVVRAGQTTQANIDMSRPEFVDKLPQDQKELLEELKSRKQSAMEANEIIPQVNADLTIATREIHDADQAASEEIKTAKYTEVERLMNKDIAAKPDASILWVRLGEAQLGLKNYNEAQASFKKALDWESWSKHPQAEVQSLALMKSGEALAWGGKTDDAAAAFDAAAKVNPSRAEFYLQNETKIFYQLGLVNAQIAAADKAITVDPNPDDPDLAVVYYLKARGLLANVKVDPLKVDPVKVDPVKVDPKTGPIALPPDCAEAFEKYMELAPNGPYAAGVRRILDTAGYKANP